ncbi:hypothetical protein ACNF49_40020 [Actinomadura sp. ATCC 39365]
MWAEGMGGNELARRLGADPNNAHRCGLDLAATPLAEVHVPVRIPTGFHGNRIPG